MRNILFLVILISSQIGIAQESEIRSILDNQIEAWNKGDLEGFMYGYWESEELLFVGSNGPKRGWMTTLGNYKKSYPDKSAMGTLSFELQELKPLGKKYFFVLGRWTLKREKDEPTGFFTLIFQKIEGEWKIIADHSS